MGADPEGRTVSEAEVRGLISLQIVIDSARAAGLEVASPIHPESGEALLVYGGDATAESPLWARRVRVRAFDSGLETAALAGPVSPGEVLALVEWGGLGEEESVFLLAGKGHREREVRARGVARVPCHAAAMADARARVVEVHARYGSSAVVGTGV